MAKTRNLDDKMKLFEQIKSWGLPSITHLADFLRTGSSNTVYKGSSSASRHVPVVRDEWDSNDLSRSCGIFAVRENRLLLVCEARNTRDFVVDSNEPLGGIIFASRQRGFCYHILSDGDNEIYPAPILKNSELAKHPTISYRCVAELMRNAESRELRYRVAIQDVMEAIAVGTIKVLDFTLDTYTPLTKKQHAQAKSFNAQGLLLADIRSIRSHISAEPGFTLVRSYNRSGNYIYKWHKSGHVLLQHKDQTWLVGQDEGTYFGVELSEPAKTVKQALLSLMPKEARKKKGVLRQGEWFFVPIAPPKTKEGEILIESGSFVLPRENDDSNHHTLNLSYGQCCISSNDICAVNFFVVHREHARINSKTGQWYRILKNTAKQSVSVEGVD